ncbi:MAG: bifunctional nuclease family protein, partial [Candidatus Latescibacteria bacterium]|nr:bifunctional nuclease family protein [Candidatus Latescibacterota bacterium]
MIEMEVVAVQPEPSSNHPLVWLKDKDQRVFLPIAIGNFEAIAIFMELYNEPPPRPITYDLLRSIIDGFHVRVEQVFINALKDETYYAEITLMRDGQSICIDSRPSDA